MSAEPGNSKKSLGIFTRRPAVSTAVLLAVGILLHNSVPHREGLVLLAAAVLSAIAAITLQYRIISTLCASLLVLTLGIGLAQREHFDFAPHDIALFATDEPRLTEIEAKLTEDPRIIVSPPMGLRPMPPKQLATVTVRQIRTHHGWIETTGELPIQIIELHPALHAGQIVHLLGMLQRPRAAANPGEFDWAAFYRQQRILATMTINRAGNVHIIADTGASPSRWAQSKIRHLLAMGFTSHQASEHAVLDAMMLGDHDPPLHPIQDEFLEIGVGYQLSACGLHIGFFAWIVFGLSSWLRFRPRCTLGITTAFVVLYVLIAAPSHSGVRTAILTVVVTAAAVSGRNTDRLQILSLAAIAMLLWHPMDLYSAGFHLSFAVVFAFAFLIPALRNWLRSRRNPDVVARPAPIKQTRFQIIRDASLTWGVRCIQFAVIAWLVTLPLVALNFGRASVYSVLGSLVSLPLVLLSMIAGAIKILLTLLWPFAAGTWATFFGLPTQLLLWSVHQLSRLPGSSIAVAAPSIWLILFYYLLLFSPLLPHRFGLVGGRRWLLWVAPVLGVMAIFSSSLHPQTLAHPDSLRVTLLSLGAGQCAVVELPNGHAVLIDAGSTTVSDVAQKVVEPFLRADGDEQIDAIFLSHGDFDHISAATEITSAYDVPQVLTSFHFRRNAAGNIPDQVLLDELEKLNRSPKEISQSDRIDLGGGATISVLWPPQTGDLNSNNAGLVLRLTYAGKSILFPADIQDPAFIGVLKNASALKSDVLIAPHHGSSEDLTPRFLNAVQPRYILSSNFSRLSGKQKMFETMTGRVPLYRTPECGAITVTIKSDGNLVISTFAKHAVIKR